MSRLFGRTLRTAYVFAITALCLVISIVMLVFGWLQRIHSRSDVAFSLLLGGFFLYAAVVVAFQAVEDWKYRRALDALGFLPFNWAKVPIQPVLAGIAKGHKAFVSRGFQGRIGATDIYVFNFGTDTAWWGMRKVAAVLPNVSKVEHAERRQLLMKRADAELDPSPEWIVVRSRGRVSPDAFHEWVTTVVNTLASN